MCRSGRYSNDHFQAPLDQVQVTIDGTPYTFAAADTATWAGWDQFRDRAAPARPARAGGRIKSWSR